MREIINLEKPIKIVGVRVNKIDQTLKILRLKLLKKPKEIVEKMISLHDSVTIPVPTHRPVLSYRIIALRAQEWSFNGQCLGILLKGCCFMADPVV